jgi:HD superfamily phosphohydrolase
MDRITARTQYIFSKDERAIARAFALLHDASQLPFGHTLEDEHNLFPRHDKGTRLLQIIDQSELKAALGDLHEPVRAIVEYVSLGYDWRIKPIHPLVKPYLVDIVAGTIGADLLDYLRRDNLFTGLRREYDPRVFEYFEIQEDQLVVALTKYGLVRVDAVSDIMDLLRMRYTLAEKVYYHHTKLAFGAMLAKAVRMAQNEGLLDEKRLALMGDWDLLHYLSEDLKMPDAVRKLTHRITPRDTYLRAFAYPRRGFRGADDKFFEFVDKYRDTDALTTLSVNIAVAANIPPEDVVVYCPTRQMQLKEANVPVYADGKIKPLIDMRNNMPQEAKLYYDKFKNLWTFYVFAHGDRNIVKRVGKVTTEILGKRNYYDISSK